MITGEAGASNRGSSGGDATTTSNIRVEQFPGIDDLSPELLLIIANYLPPSDVLKFSIASEKAAFLQPDFDEVKINSHWGGTYLTKFNFSKLCRQFLMVKYVS